MGGVFGRFEGGLILEPPPRIRGSKWSDQERLMSCATSTEEVSLLIPTSPWLERRVDWSDIVQDCFLNLCDGSGLTGSWFDPILVCASAMDTIGAAKPLTQPSSSSQGSAQMLVLDNVHQQPGLPSSILIINKASGVMLMELLSRHPVVTSLRCSEGRVFSLSIDEAPRLAPLLGLNPQPWYDGKYNLDCIPRCGVLVGYDMWYWTIFDLNFHIFYRVERDLDYVPCGVGEFVLVPM